jgi:Domain of unknown function (DUF397)
VRTLQARPVTANALTGYFPLEHSLAKETSGPAELAVRAEHSAQQDGSRAAEHLVWRSRCGAHGSCIEFANLHNTDVAIRDSKLSDKSPILVFDQKDWKSFLSGIHAGEFG